MRRSTTPIAVLPVLAVLSAFGTLAPAAGPVQGPGRADAAPVAADPANLGPTALPDVEGGYASDHILLRVRPGVSLTVDGGGRPGFLVGSSATAATRSAERLLGAAKAIRATAPFAQAANRALAARLGMDRVYRIDVPVGTDTPRLVRSLAPLATLFDRVELDGVGGLAGLIPNDPEFPNQYAFHNTGQLIAGVPGAVDADIDAPEAWELAATRGIDTSSISVAVLDSGINQHVQLAGRILPGFNIPDNSTVVTDECSSHGTHVSGIIAASGNDAVGSTGLAWKARIAPYVVVNGCTGVEVNVATGLTMATDAGYRIVNMSLQFYTGSQTLHDAVLYAYAHDVIMVAAAGNNNNANVAYPAKWPETICVAATTNTDVKASFSNFGPEVDVCAGGDIVRSLTGTTGYGDKSGTSQATPAVTGTIALMRAWNPGLKPDQARQILVDTATDIGTPGFDNSFGYGRLNAYAALLATPSGNPQDLDNDGAVGPADLAILLGAWGSCADCDGGCAADFDGDCAVGPSDLAILLGAWG